MKHKNLYTDTGEPKRICCYWAKRSDCCDPITVVLTHAQYIDKIYQGYIVYIGMTESGNHYYGSQSAGTPFHAGSRVKFTDLPEPCRETVVDIYRKVWEENYFIMA